MIFQVLIADAINWTELMGAPGINEKLVNPSEPQNFIGNTISELLPFVLTFGGIALLIMLIMGGFTMLTNPTNPQAQEQGKQRLTFAVIGFLLLFLSYWIIQILQIIFNINIIGTPPIPSSTSGSSSEVEVPAPEYSCSGDFCYFNTGSCFCNSGADKCYGSFGPGIQYCCEESISDRPCE